MSLFETVPLLRFSSLHLHRYWLSSLSISNIKYHHWRKEPHQLIFCFRRCAHLWQFSSLNRLTLDIIEDILPWSDVDRRYVVLLKGEIFLCDKIITRTSVDEWNLRVVACSVRKIKFEVKFKVVCQTPWPIEDRIFRFDWEKSDVKLINKEKVFLKTKTSRKEQDRTIN